MSTLAALVLCLFQGAASKPQSRPQSRPDPARATTAGVEWLLAHREADGHWRGGALGSRAPADTMATGLAVLALLATGRPHQGAVADAVQWLRAQQGTDGFIGSPAATLATAGHAVATLALSEVSVLGHTETAAEAAAKAVQYLLDARARAAIWTRDPRGGPEDQWALPWAVLALRSARDATIPVAPDALAEIQQWLEAHTEPSGAMPVAAGAAEVVTTPALRAAGGLTCRIFLGQPPGGELMTQAADLVLTATGPLTAGAPLDLPFLYLGTAALLQIGGPRWERWEALVLPPLLAGQRTGPDAGSWDPPSPDRAALGRTGATALGVLSGSMFARMARLRGRR